MEKGEKCDYETLITDKICARLYLKPSSLAIPSWSSGTFFVYLGWFKKVRCWDSAFGQEIQGVKISKKNAAKLQAAKRFAQLTSIS